MDSQPNHALQDDDLSALAWVQEELRKSLDAAHKALRRTLKEVEAAAGSDVDAVESTALRQARAQLHQGAGVLELISLPAGAALLQAAEAAVQRYVAKPHKLTLAAVETIERASFALLDFVARRLAGKAVSPVAMFPQYRAVQELAGAERVHPADLWHIDWQWLRLPVEVGAAPRGVDAAVVSEFEAQVLALMRGGSPADARRLGNLSAALAAGAALPGGSPEAVTLWQLAAAYYEALALELLRPDVYSKRVTSRLLAQLRAQARGDLTVSERLAQDLLFFCALAQAPQPGVEAPRLAAVRQAWALDRVAPPADYEQPQLGRHDPAAVAQAVKRVSTAKDGWSAVAGGEMHRLGNLNEQFSLVADSLRKLLPNGEQLADALLQSAHVTVQSKAAPAPALAMEVATSLLWVDAALEEGGFDHPQHAPRVARLAERIAAVRGGAAPEALEPWMEELYRRVADRQTMGSVVQELRASLAETEKTIDRYFRSPAEPDLLMPVPGQLQAMRGVLSVLGLDQGSHAVLRMRDDVDALIAAQAAAASRTDVFDRLAGNLSALSFLIDLLGVQPQAAKSLFLFDAESGLLRSLVGARGGVPATATLAEQAQRLASDLAAGTLPLSAVSREVDRLAHEPQVSAVRELTQPLEALQQVLAGSGTAAEPEAQMRERVGQALNEFAATASEAVGLEPVPSGPLPLISLSPMPPLAPPPAAPASTGLEEDDEMREVFLEEAREVIDGARAALVTLRSEPGDGEAQVTVRRAFHTLKGSSRMVGLADFGEAAWACEQLYNHWLASQQPASEELLRFTSEALDYFAPWVDAIAERAAALPGSEPVRRSADALRVDGLYRPLRYQAAAPAPATPAPALDIASLLPPASELELPAEAATPLPEVIDAAPIAPVESATVAAPEPGLGFTLDFGGEPPAPAQPAMPLPLAETLDFSLDLASFDLATPAPASPSAVPAELPALDDVVGGGESEDFATMPLPLDEQPKAPSVLDEAVITSIELTFEDSTPADGGTTAADIGLIEALQPSAEGESRLPVPELIEPVVEEGSSVLPELDDDELQKADAGPSLIEALAPTSQLDAMAANDALAEPAEAVAELPVESPAEPPVESDQVKIVGPLRISIPLFNIYLNEADELSRRLGTELSEWALELHRPVGESAIALAHSLGGSSATVGFADLSALARQLEHALMRSHSLGHGFGEDAQLFGEAAEEIRRLLHQFAAGFLKAAAPELLQRLADFDRIADERAAAAEAAPAVEAAPATEAPSQPVEAATAEPVSPVAPIAAAEVSFEPPPAAPPIEQASVLADLGQAEFRPLAPLVGEAEPVRAASFDALDDEDDIDAEDAVDVDLFPIFEEEALDLLPKLSGQLRDWSRHPADAGHASAAMRTLHTFKGGARLAGAMRLGELAHRLETAIEHLLAREDERQSADIDPLHARADALSASFDQLRRRDAEAYAQQAAAVAVAEPQPPVVPEPPVLAVEMPTLVVEEAPTPGFETSGFDVLSEPGELHGLPPDQPPAATIDWSRFAGVAAEAAPAARTPSERATLAGSAVRVRAHLLDRLVNQAGEVSIARARLDAGVGTMRGALNDLTDNLERLRAQLRDIELQAETQMSSRMEAAKAASKDFDPLEFDRYTRFQEITRMMAESVNDVATVQRALQRTIEVSEDELAAQARLTRELQDDLLRTRMVEFEGLSDRLYRVVRQAAKETGKQVRLDLLGGSIEVDRSVLDRMTGAFEHLLRNCVTHGIESPEQRSAAGKDPVGTIVVALHQEGNEVAIEFRDDGAGLNFARIRARGVALGLVAPDAQVGEAELANLIFTPGFSTAEQVTELAGRGVGMDVVRAEVNALGGRIETASAAGQGTSFKLVLPLTTAVTQVVMLRCGAATIAVPATLIEIVRRATPTEVKAAYTSGIYQHGEHSLPFFWLGALLSSSARASDLTARSQSVVVIRSAQQRIALHVDEVLGNQEVVVKNLGSQLSRLPGLAGMTLLASGAVALIYNPVALATVYGEAARAASAAAIAAPERVEVQQQAPSVPQAPLVLVVDDSLTVRRVTQRLLAREGYRVSLAKDGLEGLERVAEERPSVVLSDIEMPRMDGFDFVRNLRGDPKLADLPVIMITSRIAQKHRDVAAELGVNHYLGKPYSEEELLSLIAQYSAQALAA
ncbi:Hpt domain-containing protein [Caldimonas sp. KR1-144]|uniref:hybrid sensor histidine kinase/response regulator n=1 Tax=Caldimonas sp. KR1-144 TaxID=3400911 RepID=UPI003C0A7181